MNFRVLIPVHHKWRRCIRRCGRCRVFANLVGLSWSETCFVSWNEVEMWWIETFRLPVQIFLGWKWWHRFIFGHFISTFVALLRTSYTHWYISATFVCVCVCFLEITSLSVNTTKVFCKNVFFTMDRGAWWFSKIPKGGRVVVVGCVGWVVVWDGGGEGNVHQFSSFFLRFLDKKIM